MPATITTPTDTVKQLSGRLANQETVLAVLAKRTYRIDRTGRCLVAEKQLPLQEEVVYGDDLQELVLADCELAHFKPLTDVVVLGQVHCVRPQAELGAGLRVGSATKLVKVIGKRRATIDSRGRVLFSPPEPFDRVPLNFALAYGGRDISAETKYGIPATKFKQFLPPGLDIRRFSPYLYPRNPCGRGYLVELTREAVEGLELPQLEDPEDRLTPDRLVVGDPRRWTAMPVPQSLGWLGHTWFPRSAFFGVQPEHAPPSQTLFEVRKGWVPADILVGGPIPERFSMRAANGASLGLQLPYLRGDEEITLYNLSSLGPELRFKLPAQLPSLFTDGRKGKLNRTKPVIHSVVIEPDELRLSIVWRGNAPALRPYLRDELASMPLRVDW